MRGRKQDCFRPRISITLTFDFPLHFFAFLRVLWYNFVEIARKRDVDFSLRLLDPYFYAYPCRGLDRRGLFFVAEKAARNQTEVALYPCDRKRRSAYVQILDLAARLGNGIFTFKHRL